MEFWDIFQQDTDDPHPLRAYLITPIQRITRYQLLLKEILKYTTRANEDITQTEEALSKVSSIIRHANDSMHIKRIVGYEVSFAWFVGNFRSSEISSMFFLVSIFFSST